MKDEHILNLLDENLSEANSAQVQAHIANCQSCRQAAAAARISSALFRAESAQTFEPSPFFQTKVLNALRERQALRKPMAIFRRWWQASAALIAVMVMVLVSLIGLTVFAPTTNANEAQAENNTNDNPYSTEAVLMHRKMQNNLTTEQTMEIIYTTKNGRRSKGKMANQIGDVKRFYAWFSGGRICA